MSVTITITSPATATALTTLENVRADLKLAADRPDSTQLSRFIAQASADAASFCQRTFGRQTVRQRFVGCGMTIVDAGGGLLLEAGPVCRILGVAADGVALAPEGFEIDGAYLYALRDTYRTPWSARSVVVDYEAGWFLPSESGSPPAGTPKLPADVERAVIQLIGVSNSGAARDATLKSETVEGIGSRSYATPEAGAALPHAGAEATLNRYRSLVLV